MVAIGAGVFFGVKKAHEYVSGKAIIGVTENHAKTEGSVWSSATSSPAQKEATSTTGIVGWKTYTNDKYGIEFSYPAGIKLKEAEKSFVDGSNIKHAYFDVGAQLPFTSNYNTWKSKLLDVSIENVSGTGSCHINPGVYVDGQKIEINGRNFFFSKEYHNYDSIWTQSRKETTEENSVENEAAVYYVTKTNSFCYSFSFLLAGPGPNSEDLYGVEGVTFPHDSQKFFDSEQEVFNKIISTINISSN